MNALVECGGNCINGLLHLSPGGRFISHSLISQLSSLITFILCPFRVLWKDFNPTFTLFVIFSTNKLKFSFAVLLTVVAAVSAVPNSKLSQRGVDCADKGANCGGPGDRGCCAGTTCKSTFAPVGGVGKICQ
ncbi:hypothetical protein C8035_v003023 [Colletotrichum spinosum]|uniref:Uncharacterized protein n=1 Tax=Colletotrichum spinosum TaxID=1347390 RepID=A0A4R8PNX1_9PEZI|nr:hypothetical protein C8035_v003023 [Colletotrichum spinosum]